MQAVALSFLAIFSLPFVYLIGQTIYRRFFAVPPIPRGIQIIRIGGKWGVKDGFFVSSFIFRTRRGAVLHAIGYRQALSRL